MEVRLGRSCSVTVKLERKYYIIFFLLVVEHICDPRVDSATRADPETIYLI